MQMGPRWLKIAGFSLLSILLALNAYLLLPGASRLSRLESDLDNHSGKLAKLESPVSASDELSENLEYLNTRVHMLTNFITDLEVKLTSLKAVAESISDCQPRLKTEAAAQEVLAVTRPSDHVVATLSPAAANANTESPEDEPARYDEPQQPAAPSANTESLEDEQARYDKPQQPAAPVVEHLASAPAATEITDQGSWVINLASLDNQAAADRFSARAQAKGIRVQQQIASVKGKQRWRIRVTGFATLSEARINAGPIQEKLGLKNVWISQR
jgi:cell division septation protein DedD